MKRDKNILMRRAALLAIWVLVCMNFSLSAADLNNLQREATWSQPTAEQLRMQVDAWLDQSENVSEEQKASIADLWQRATPQSSDDLFHVVIESIAMVDSRAQEVLDFCNSAASTVSLPTFDWLRQKETHPFVSNNLRLYYGQWLGLRSLYNEVLEQLDGLQPSDVADPASLLFFQASANHRLLAKDKSLPLISTLMEQNETIPRRYATMARLMEADLKPLKEDSLDEVSRLMDNIRTRLNHGRAGTRVRKEEDDVIAKLDKMIEKLEQQQQQQQQSSGQSGGQQQQGGQNGQGNNPLQESQLG
ncbi:MAG: hypothetical protein KDB27_10220, partial [Planctomycetales bacterium]|nr:hypothetical protein [Planctomycetales bacterium]